MSILLILFSVNKAINMVIAVILKDKKKVKHAIITVNIIKIATNHNQILSVLIGLPF